MSDIAVHVEQSRAEGIPGASEAAAILGLDQYTAPITVWRKLRGLEVEEKRPAFVEEAAEWGQALEPIVRGKYALTQRAPVLVPEESRIFDGWLRATPDGYVMKPGDMFAPGMTYTAGDLGIGGAAGNLAFLELWALGLLQVKTCSLYKRDEWTTWIPAAYEVQVRTEIAVCDLPWCDVVCLVGGQHYVGPFRVERDLAIEDRILTDLRAFCDLVKRGIEPSPDHTDAWRAHVSEKMPKAKLVIRPSAEEEAAIKAWTDTRRQLAKLKTEEAAQKTGLLLRLSAAGATGYDLGADRGKVTAYSTGAKPLWKQYAVALGAKDPVPEKYKGKPGAWTLRAPGGDDDE